MIAAALLLVQAGSAVPPPPRDIVVTAQSPDKLRDDLAACIARSCPPKEEIARSLAYAEAQLVAGDYHGSRRTLLKARGRNRRYAADLPVDVSDLHRANARLADLNGLRDAARAGTFDVVDALKAGLPRDDWRIMAARLEVGANFARQGRAVAALSHYKWVERQAKSAGASLVVGMARFRRAALLAALADASGFDSAEARKVAAAVLASNDPDWAPFRNGVRLIPVHLSPAKERPALLAKAMAELEPQSADLLQPVYSPLIDMRGVGFGAARGDDDTQWADVGFRIAPDGRVADVEVLRKSERLRDEWLEVALRSLRERRYVPLQLPAGSPGVARMERYSLVSDLVSETGGHIPTRSPTRRMDVLDLSPSRDPAAG